jgi:hypothetical protein
MRNGIGKSFRDSGPSFPAVLSAPITGYCAVFTDDLPFVESDYVAVR